MEQNTREKEQELELHGYTIVMNKTFVIGIDDGEHKYAYPITIENPSSIYDFYRKICRNYGVEPKEGLECPSDGRSILKLLEAQEIDRKEELEMQKECQ